MSSLLVIMTKNHCVYCYTQHYWEKQTVGVSLASSYMCFSNRQNLLWEKSVCLILLKLWKTPFLNNAGCHNHIYYYQDDKRAWNVGGVKAFLRFQMSSMEMDSVTFLKNHKREHTHTHTLKAGSKKVVQTSRLPPTLARRGGRGLSFSFLSWRRDCLRPAGNRRRSR